MTTFSLYAFILLLETVELRSILMSDVLLGLLFLASD